MSKFPIRDNIDMFRSATNLNCFEIEGKYYHININEDDVINSPIIKNNISTLDGLYVWVLSENDIHFLKVFSIAELYSKHSYLVYRLNLEKLNLAGEMYVHNNKILYNFLSGTYMLDVVDGLNPDKNIVNEFESFLSGLSNMKIKYYPNPMIDKKFINITLNDLNILHKHGIPINVYTNKEDCNKKKDYRLTEAYYNSNLKQIERQNNTLSRLFTEYQPRELPKKPESPPKGSDYIPLKRSDRTQLKKMHDKFIKLSEFGSRVSKKSKKRSTARKVRKSKVRRSKTRKARRSKTRRS